MSSVIPDYLSEEELRRLRARLFAGPLPTLMRPSTQARRGRRSWRLRIPYLRLLRLYPGLPYRDAAAILRSTYWGIAQLAFRLRQAGYVEMRTVGGYKRPFLTAQGTRYLEEQEAEHERRKR